MSKIKESVLRFGAIGCGTVFNHAHIHAYLDLCNVELVGLFDNNQRQAIQTREHFEKLIDERIKQLQHEEDEQEKHEESSENKKAIENLISKKNCIKVYDNLEDLFANVDVVDICTPVKYHIPIAIEAIKKSVHVMSEKPAARNWLEIEGLVKELKKSQKILYQLNDDNLFLPRYQMIRHVIESGDIGEVVSIWIARGSHGPQERAWFWDPQTAGGGSLWDYGTHAVTSTWYLVGMDKVLHSVKSFTVTKKHKHRIIAGRVQEISVEDDAHFKVFFKDPSSNDIQTVVIEATWSWPELGKVGSDVTGYIEVKGSEGDILGYIDERGDSCLKVSKRGWGENILKVPTTTSERESFRAEIRNFSQCIYENKLSILNEYVAEEVTAALGAVYLSELSGRITISLEEFKNFCREEAKGEESKEEAISKIIAKLTQKYKAIVN